MKENSLKLYLATGLVTLAAGCGNSLETMRTDEAPACHVEGSQLICGKESFELPQGPVGPRGETGYTGYTGAPGADGAAGRDGRDGATGATGPMGPQGEAGPAGAAGVNGLNGQNGRDGQDGMDGADGVDGVDGATGPAGPAGTPGTVVTSVAFCPTVAGTYPEYGMCIDNVLFAVFDTSANNDVRLSKLLPGTYTTTDGRSCTFTVTNGCNIQ